jgi:hypothetical protein
LYFNKSIDGFQDDEGFLDGKGWDFWRNPLNMDGTNTRGQYVNYQELKDTNQLDVLNILRVRAKWYDYTSWFLIPGPIWMGLINAGF